MGNWYSQCLGAVTHFYASRTFTDPIELRRLHEGVGSSGGSRNRGNYGHGLSCGFGHCHDSLG